MKIKEITVENVKGIPNGTYPLNEKLTIITGPNGSGKTSFLNLVETVLTKSKTPDNFIKNGAKKGILTMTVTDLNDMDNVITMSKTSNSNVIFKFNGVNSSLSALQEWIKSNCGITNDAEIVKYSDIAGLKPKELANFIGLYIPESYTKQDILKFKKKSYKAKTWGCEEEVIFVDKDIDFVSHLLESLLPEENITKETIAQIENSAKEQLVLLKQNIAFLLKTLENWEQPANAVRNLSAAYADYDEALNQKSNLALIEAQWKQYEQQNLAYQQYMTALQEMYAKINAIQVENPNISQLPALQDLQKQWSVYYDQLNKNIALANQQIAMLQTAVNKLSTSTCPLSDRLICTTDKTPIKQELETQIAELQKNITLQTEQKTDAETKLSEIQNQLKTLSEQQNLFNQKQNMIEQFNTMNQNKPSLPVKPEYERQNIDLLLQKLENLSAEIKLITAYNQYQLDLSDLAKAKQDYHYYNFLCQWLSDKGEIMEGMMKKYVSKLNKLIETQTKTSYTNWEIAFVFDNGLVPTLSVNQAKAMPYPDLSTGEKAIVDLFIVNLLNRLSEQEITVNDINRPTGLRTLLIDGLEKLDKKNYETFIQALSQSVANDYDNIIINLVNHNDLINTTYPHNVINF